MCNNINRRCDEITQPQARSNWRTREIEEPSNLYLIHPASAALTSLFARWGWSPNAVSALGMVSALVASWGFYHYQSIEMSVLGMGFMIGWHVLDGTDGQLARLTGKTSEFGKVIDGLCDHLGFGMVYIALALALQPEYGPWIWLLTLAAGLSHAIQAGALEFHRGSYDCWVHRKTGKCVPPPDSMDVGCGRAVVPWLIHKVHLLYIRLQYLVSEADRDIIAAEEGLRRHPSRNELGDSYRLHSLGTVRRWAWLSANKRTIAVSLFCILKLPILFFFYEIIILNGLLIWLRQLQRGTNQDLRVALLSESRSSVPRHKY